MVKVVDVVVYLKVIETSCGNLKVVDIYQMSLMVVHILYRYHVVHVHMSTTLCILYGSALKDLI